MRDRGIVVLPDLYANAGVVVSYFEWVKNLTRIPLVRWNGVITRQATRSRTIRLELLDGPVAH